MASADVVEVPPERRVSTAGSVDSAMVADDRIAPAVPRGATAARATRIEILTVHLPRRNPLPIRKRSKRTWRLERVSDPVIAIVRLITKPNAKVCRPRCA